MTACHLVFHLEPDARHQALPVFVVLEDEVHRSVEVFRGCRDAPAAIDHCLRIRVGQPVGLYSAGRREAHKRGRMK